MSWNPILAMNGTTRRDFQGCIEELELLERILCAQASLLGATQNMHINGLGPVIFIAALRRHGISSKAHGYLYGQSYTLHLRPRSCCCGTTLHSVSLSVGNITGYCSAAFRSLDLYYVPLTGIIPEVCDNSLQILEFETKYPKCSKD